METVEPPIVEIARWKSENSPTYQPSVSKRRRRRISSHDYFVVDNYFSTGLRNTLRTGHWFNTPSLIHLTTDVAIRKRKEPILHPVAAPQSIEPRILLKSIDRLLFLMGFLTIAALAAVLEFGPWLRAHADSYRYAEGVVGGFATLFATAVAIRLDAHSRTAGRV